MSYTNHRRKICEIESQKQNYIRHLNRLQKLKSGHSPQQLKRGLEQRRLINTINEMRKIHTYNRDFRIKQMKSVQKAQKDRQKDYTKVKSVIKKNISKLVLTVPTKHKKNYQPIIEQNQKILQRILQTKSTLNISAGDMTQRTVKVFPNIAETDFSMIYQNSQLNQNYKQRQVLKLNFCRNNNCKSLKLLMQFNEDNLSELFHDLSELYYIQIVRGDKHKKTNNLILSDFINKTISLKIPENSFHKNGISMKFVKVLPNKNIVKGIVEIRPQDFYDSSQKQELNQGQSLYYLQKQLISLKGKQQSKTKLQIVVRKTIKLNNAKIKNGQNKNQACILTDKQ